MRYAILEESWVTGNLSYVAMRRSDSRTADGELTTLQRHHLYATYVKRSEPLPSDMAYADRATAERDAALFRSLAPEGAELSYWTVRLDPPGLAAVQALADARMNGFKQVANL
jgi:hypothetical protein